MKTIRIAIITGIIGIGLGIAGIQLIQAITFNPKEYAKTNHCPYEGMECPNAQQAFMDAANIASDTIVFYQNKADEQLAIAKDLRERVQFLEGQLAMYKDKCDHSRIPDIPVDYTSNLEIHKDGAKITSIVYTDASGLKYRLHR